MAFNPFTYLPDDLCAALDLPDFPTDQECTLYEQLQSEVSGLIVVPAGASIPENWNSFPNAWYGLLLPKIVNTNPDKAHFIAGIGSFLPNTAQSVNLANGRVDENREYSYRLILDVKNLADGHIAFGRSLMLNKKDFTFFVVTIGGTSARVIGGSYGLNPTYVNAVFPFNSGPESRETMQLIIDTEFLQFPAMPLP